jgi:uncharacterized membrane protein
MDVYLLDWANMLVRWLHLIAGIAWIGASFYFVMLDTSLKPPKKPEDQARGVFGELWAVHGGGFYISQKFLTGPKGEPLTQDLHWSKWEAYTTWLSGMSLLVLIYWIGARTYLIDPNVMDLSPAAAIGLSILTLVAGWLVYDGLCRVLGDKPMLLGILIYAFVVLVAWALFHVFGARAAYVHVGAMIGTIMVANVFFVIIPGQRKMVEAIRAGQAPDPIAGLRGKIRSVHNTYFTLPVLFVMISNHYPMTYGSRFGWLVLALIGASGVLIREFFVARHRGRVNYALPAAAVVVLAVVGVIIAPSAAKTEGATAVTFATVQPIFAQRCAVCHSEKPTQPGIDAPPLGVMLDTPARIQAAAPRIQQQVIVTQVMPIGNLTKMTPEERAQVGAWLAAGAKLD